jgi:hypothetical protein
VTVKVKALPATVLPGAVTAKWVAAAGLTAMMLLVPVIVGVTVSLAVIVWLPAVRSVARKRPLPLTRVLVSGKPARASLLVKWTVPL